MSASLIACLNIPRFAVEAERHRRRETAARLILLGEGTVYDCSLGAEVSHVKRGMRMSEAIGLCPRAIVLPPDIPYYEKLFEQVLDFLEGFSPEVDRGALGTAYLSLRGLPVSPQPFAEELIAAVHRAFGFMPSVGIAGAKFVSRVAASTARPGRTKVLPPGGEKQFLAPLPVDHLPASEAMLWRLHMLGIETMREITRVPIGAFQAQFGPEGKRCWELAQGIDEEPLIPRTREETLVRRLEMPSPAGTIEAILMGVERLVYAAYGGPERGERWVRKAVVRAALDGGGSWELPVAFREAMADPRDAWFAIKGAITRSPPARPVEELEVELVGLSGESGKQAPMFEGKGKLWRQVEEAVRQLGVQEAAKSGRPLIGKVVEVEPWSRIPERRAVLADFDP